MPQFENKYDLEDRTSKFSSELIVFCKKEAKETLYWLELIGKSIDEHSQKEKARGLWQEAKEFILIFGKIAYSTKK
ncbi:MAG: hypothetical protein Q8Q48_00705 [Candidatus Staskawiczbacteria bacterium]|nr:hypothetical protein [Candidatus Staskawiczbacteria bacterium]